MYRQTGTHRAYPPVPRAKSLTTLSSTWVFQSPFQLPSVQGVTPSSIIKFDGDLLVDGRRQWPLGLIQRIIAFLVLDAQVMRQCTVGIGFDGF